MKQETPKYDIFISYRRENGEDTAKHLRDILVAKGYSVFFDTDSLQSGDFNRALLDVIENCKDFIIILSPNALDRCVNEKDWVRQELACALRNGKNIIPVFHRNFHFPEELPEDINDVRWKNGIDGSIKYFDAMVHKLIKFLHSKPKFWMRKSIMIPSATCLLAAAALIFLLPRWNTGNKPVTAPETVQEVSVTNEPVQTAKPVQTAIPVNTPEPVTEMVQESSGPDNTPTDSAQVNSSSLETAANGTADKKPMESSLWNYEIVGDHVELMGYTGTETDLVIPETLEGLPVTVIKSVAETSHGFVITRSGFPSGISSLTVPGTVELIGSRAFADCDSLKRVVLCDGVKEIGESAFSSCTKLSEIIIPESVSAINSRAFYSCMSLFKIELPAGADIVGVNPFQECRNLQEITVIDGSGKGHISSSESILFNADKTTLLCYPAGKTNQNYTIPDSVSTIAQMAFCQAKNLKSVTLPAGLTSVDEYAFSDCSSLESITFPAGLQSIGRLSFLRCKEMKTVAIPAGTVINSDAFEDCTGLTSVYFSSDVSVIGDKNMFEGCSSLKDIYFSGTEEEWQNLHISLNNELLSTAVIHYNSQA